MISITPAFRPSRFLRPMLMRPVLTVALTVPPPTNEATLVTTGAFRKTPAMIRKLLEERLGLRMDAKLDVSFALPPSPEPRPEVVVRSPSLPLVNAVLANERKSR